MRSGLAHPKLVGRRAEEVKSLELPAGDGNTFLYSEGCPYVDPLACQGKEQLGRHLPGDLVHPELLLLLLITPEPQDNVLPTIGACLKCPKAAEGGL